MEKKELNMMYLLKRVINSAQQNNDTFILALLVNKIIDNNEGVKIDLDLRTIDTILYNRMVDELDSTINEIDGDIPGNFCEVSEGVIKLIKLHIDKCKAEVKKRKLYENK